MLCAIVLSVIMQSVEHYNAKYFYAECDLILPGMFYVKCHYAVVIILSIIMLNLFMLNVIMLSVIVVSILMLYVILQRCCL
jgi:hypothetical protein